MFMRRDTRASTSRNSSWGRCRPTGGTSTEEHATWQTFWKCLCDFYCRLLQSRQIWNLYKRKYGKAPHLLAGRQAPSKQTWLTKSFWHTQRCNRHFRPGIILFSSLLALTTCSAHKDIVWLASSINTRVNVNKIPFLLVSNIENLRIILKQELKFQLVYYEWSHKFKEIGKTGLNQ